MIVPVDLTQPPWAGMGTVSWSELKRLVPKDALVDGNEDPLLQLAVRAVYFVVPPNQWGTQKTIEKVMKLCDEWKPWAAALEVDET